MWFWEFQKFKDQSNEAAVATTTPEWKDVVAPLFIVEFHVVGF